MHAPIKEDKTYKEYKKLQKKNPGVDIMRALAESNFNGTTETDEIAKAKTKKEDAELKLMQEEEDKKKALAEEKLKKDAKK